MSRRADGQPETPADTRFFNLRAMGYQGPIDQDGYLASNPGPVETPGSNDHRVGASNHHHNTGSGGVVMVDTTPDHMTVETVYSRLCGEETGRFLRITDTGDTAFSPHALAEFIAEIVADYTDHLVAERDALAEDLAWELHAARRAVA